MLLFPSTIEYYTSVGMGLTLFFYLPIICFSVRHITDWNALFKEIRPFAFASTLIGIYIVFLGDINLNAEYFNYMEFSYNILPFVAALYIIARRSEKYRFFWWSCFIMGACCMIVYGARASILFLALFVFCSECILVKPERRVWVILSFIIVIGLFTLFFDSIILYLTNIPTLQGSRLIAKAAVGNLTDGGERDILIQDSIMRIKSMNLEIPGLFGDRKFIRGIYPHNIFLEILMQFGIFGGSLIILSFIYISFIDIFKTQYSIPAIYLTCVLFIRYFFSGSYIQDGIFWLWLFSMINIFTSKYKLILKFPFKKHSKEGNLI